MEKREIKFRVWDTKRKKMYYDVICEFYPNGGLKVIQFNLEKKIQREIVKKEVMQYTGLKDKNGKDIYKGDIITWGGSNHIIKFENGCFTHNSKDYGQNPMYKNGNWAFGEVIGNIYENPELLNGG